MKVPALILLLLFLSPIAIVGWSSTSQHFVPKANNMAQMVTAMNTGIRVVHKNNGKYAFWAQGNYSQTWSYVSSNFDQKWSVFAGQEIKGLAIANTSRWGLVHVYFGVDTIALIRVINSTVDNQTSYSVEYVYTERENAPIRDWFVGDVDGDGYDDIVILTNSSIKFVGTEVQQQPESGEYQKMGIGNLDLDSELEIVAVSTEPAVYIYEYSDGSLLKKSKVLVEEASGYSTVDVSIAANGSSSYIITVFATGNTSQIHKISGSGSKVAQLSLSTAIKMFTLYDSNGDGVKDSLMALEYVPDSYEYVGKTYDVSGSAISQSAILSTYNDTIHSINALDISDSYSGDELFVCHGTKLSVYSSSGANITEFDEVDSDIFSVGMKEINGTKFLIYTTIGEVVSVNNSLSSRIDRISISKSNITWLAIGNLESKPFIVADKLQIGYELVIDEYGRLEEITNYLVSGKITYIDYVERYGYYIVGGLFSYVYAISKSGKILWRYAISDMLVKARLVDVQNPIILLADYSGNLHMLNASNGQIIHVFKFSGKIYALDYGDVDSGNVGVEYIVGWVNGTTSYVSVIEGSITFTIMNYSYSSMISDIGLIQYDDDSQLEIIVAYAVITNEIAILDCSDSTIAKIESFDLGSDVPSYIAYGDYTGEGALDAVILASNNDKTIIYSVDIATGLRVLANLSAIFEINRDLPTKPLALADINNDSKAELILGLESGSSANISFMSIGSGGIEIIKYYPISGSYALRDIDFVDVDNSGIEDVVCTVSNGYVYVFADNFFTESTKDTVVPKYELSFGSETVSTSIVDTDNDLYGEFFVGGSFGGVMADKLHRLTLTIVEPENASEVVYSNNHNVTLSWSYLGDIPIESFAVLVNDSIEYSNIAPNTTSVNVSFSEEGIWNVTLRAKTTYALVYYDISFSLVTDFTPPQVTFASEPSTYTNESVLAFSWNMADNLAGILKTIVYLNGSAREGNDTFYKFLANCSALYNFTLVVYDKAGNYVVNERNIYVDLDPPMIWLINPTQDIIYTNSPTPKINLEWNATDNFGLSEIRIFVDNELKTTLSPDTTAFLLSNLDEGDHTVFVVAVDLAGNTMNDSIRVIVDRTPPIIQLLSPENNSAFSESMISISFMVSDSLSGVKSVKVFFDGALIQTVYNKTAAGIPLDLSTLENPEGVHNVSIIVTDNAGNSRTGRTSFIYDVTPPDIIIESPKEGTTSIPEITISWYANDSLSGIAELEIWIGGKLLLKQTYNGEMEINGSKKVRLDIGTHKITIVIQDRAGNPNTASVTVEVNPAPTTNTTILIIIIAVIVTSAIASYVVFRKYLKKKLRRRQPRIA